MRSATAATSRLVRSVSTALVFAGGASAAFGAAALPHDIEHTASIIHRADGAFDVTCADGTTEVATEADLRASNVCPHVDGDVASPTLTTGNYVVDGGGSYFVGDQLDVTPWAVGQYIVSGQIRYGSYVASFQVPVGPTTPGGTVFSGESSLLSGDCSWNISLEVYSYGDKFYLREYSPNRIYDDCTAGPYGWNVVASPFLLRQR